MKVLVTGSSGHLGEALVRTLTAAGDDVTGLDSRPSPFTARVGSVSDRACVRTCMTGVETVYHTATLHKPHLATHTLEDFIDTNIRGTAVLLEEAVASGVESFIFTSTTSVFGHALRPPAGTPAVWVTEDLKPIPRNIYGVTKTTAEDLCELIHRNHGLNCIILRTSRFFPEEDDDRTKRERFTDANSKANEFLFRRVELEDVVNAHLLSRARAAVLGFGRYIISATTPFQPADMPQLNTDAPAVVRTRVPTCEALYRQLGWKMFDRIDRVYVNTAAVQDLGWAPKFTFSHVLDCLEAGVIPQSPITRAVGSKGYHDRVFEDGPYPVDPVEDPAQDH